MKEKTDNIDILEELKEWFNNFDLDSIKHKPEEYIQAIETLIAENKELKEKNEKMEELLKEIENRNYNDYTGCQDGNEVKYNILLELQSLLGKE